MNSSTPRLSRRTFSLAAASAVLTACTTVTTGSRPDNPAPSESTASTTPPPTPPVAPSASVKPQRPIRVGLALGGGAARGFAHIGVIKALEARNIQVDLVAGTSAGSVVAALYASGMNGFALNKLALNMDEASISDWAMPFRARGFLQGVALQNYLNTTLNNRPIEKMAKPLGVVATDLNTGQPILFRRGNTGTAVRASCSVPSIFEPVKIAGHEYVDGGLVSPVPASFARKMGADFVIAVDISQRPETGVTSSSFDVLLQTFTIMGQTIKAYELDKYADVVIRPNLAAMSGSDFSQRNAAILAGEEAAARIMPELQRKLAASQAAV
ncbi:patatin-like phospholipase family protein [Paraburkholderia sp. DHOC27]|uniref:patatin-like phospholipase family protein n=1 Tax=Paraburkholderia sp. DHOC27 TaxID=2303330 RepID=UPI000E3D9A06|nr:patatin-like phospholipase family protein [Paraburkholderia sp. DHOC27]RFU45706.1 patatin-like phospholipase family protein [Paraburkholderia sp. DHOC27]